MRSTGWIYRYTWLEYDGGFRTNEQAKKQGRFCIKELICKYCRHVALGIQSNAFGHGLNQFVMLIFLIYNKLKQLIKDL